MNANDKLYESYTSTAHLAGSDEDAIDSWTNTYFRSHYLPFLPKEKTANILELGCGTGRYLHILAEMNYVNCFGVDLSEEQIRYAKTRYQLMNVEQADAIAWLDAKEDKYDCIFALDLLEHLEQDMLLEIGEKIIKALKPGGTLIVQVPNGISVFNQFRYSDLTHIRSFTFQSLQQFFLNVGFQSFSFYEIPPHATGMKSFLRRMLWYFLFKPLTKAYMMVVNGNSMGGIYTPNILAVARRDFAESTANRA